MKQARFWMLASSKSGSEYDLVQKASSCEEQAFAEDACGPFGAFIWPPRSYSCSFCGREFKSAQALGGHMNVHRRDRAGLKQHPPISESRNIHHKKPSDSRTFECPDHASTMDNISSDDVNYNSRELHHQRPFYSSNASSSDPDLIRFLSILNSNTEEEYHTKKRNCDAAKPDELPNSLTLAVSSGNNEMASCKRRRIDGLSLPLCLVNATTEELDLELRLGDQPKA